MSQPQTITVCLFTGHPDDDSGQVGILTISAATVKFGKGTAELRDVNGQLVATVAWKEPVKARRL